MEKSSAEKQPIKEALPKKETREIEPKSAEEMVEDLTAEVEDMEDAAKTTEKLSGYLKLPAEEVKDIGEKEGFFEKLSSIKDRVGEVAGAAMDKIRGIFERKEKTFEKTTMETVVASFDKYVFKNPDAKAEEIIKFLSQNPENPASPSESEIRKIKDIAERYEKNRQGLKRFVEYLAKKNDIQEIPKNPLELLATNKEIKKEFLKIAGFGEDINVDNFIIHTEVPSAIGVGCKELDDFKKVEEESCSTAGFFKGYKRYYERDASEEEKNALQSLTGNILILKETSAKDRKGADTTKVHETQHHVFAKLYSELKQINAELFLYTDLTKEDLEKMKEEGTFEDWYARLKKLKQRKGELQKNESEETARDELAAYLKEGTYIFDMESIFGEHIAEAEKSDSPLNHKYWEIKDELNRLEKSGVKPQELYPIMVASGDLNEVVKRLKEIK